MIRNASVIAIAAMMTACAHHDAGRGTTDRTPPPTLEVQPAGEGAMATASIPHFTEGTGTLECRWRVNGREIDSVTMIDRSDPQAGEAHLEFPTHAGENTVTLDLRAADGSHSSLTRLRIFGQEMTGTPPIIDGNTEDWNDPDTVTMWPFKNALHGTTGGGEAVAMAKWTPTHWYLGFRVLDTEFEQHGIISVAGPASVTVWHAAKADGSKGLFGKVAATGKELPLEIAESRDGDWYFVEMAIPIADIGFEPEVGKLWVFDMLVTTSGGLRLGYSEGTQGGLLDSQCTPPTPRGTYFQILADPADTPRPKRIQLSGGATPLKISETPTQDAAYLTPLPVEHPEAAAHLPEWLVLGIPFVGEFGIGNGYGYESGIWTHQTVANRFSANDFFCLDIGMPTGTPVVATADGRVIQSGRRGDSYGNYVVVDHGRGYTSVYAHLDSLTHRIEKGEPEFHVKRGELLGLSGNTGTQAPHLHFGVHKDSRISHSGADIGGQAVVPEPFGGYYGIRKGHRFTGP